MRVSLDLDQKYYPAVKKVLNILLPQLDIYKADEIEEADLVLTTKLDTKDGIKVTSYLKGQKDLQDEIEDQEVSKRNYDKNSFDRRCKNRIKLSVYRLLSKYLEKPLSPWGILIGVRPTKLGHYMLDRGFSYQETNQKLKNIYAISQEKRELLLDIIKLERNYIPTKVEAKNKVSIYLGIPFCPTRCDYCSFAAYPIKKYDHYLADFLKALEYEIEEIGKAINYLGLEVDTLYLGGGTPTVLSTPQLTRIIKQLKKYFITPKLREFNVEAGRPDTITRTKLEILKDNGVNRISINPQTMNLSTLEEIGRHHTISEVVNSFNLARKIGFDNINMDLIVGLPNEGTEEIKLTLQEIKNLNPDSLTVHTMAIKRASNLNRNLAGTKLPSSKEVKEMLDLTKKVAGQLGLIPYYMYRQKHILGNLENVGYAKEGKESIYNILMMEERETVIGLGGGAITKLVNPQNWSLKRLCNPKFPKQYINEIELRTEKKVSKLTSLIR